MSDYPFKAPSANPFSSQSKKDPSASQEPNRVQRVIQAAPAPVVIEKPKLPLPPLSMEEKSCRSCEFYAFDEKMERHDAYKGECRRNAPSPGQNSQGCWPVVPWKGWCGEWENGVSNEDMVRMARDIGESLANEEY